LKNSFLIYFIFFITSLFADEIVFENIIVYSNKPEFAKELSYKLSEDIFQFHKKIGKYPELTVTIYIAEDKKEFQSWTGKNTGIIEHSQAFYNGQTNAIYIRNLKEIRNLSKLHKILLHEYIHSFVRFYWKGVPLWFNEGMAVFFAGELNINRELNFAKDYILGNSRPLNQMKFHYPTSRIEWESFYAKSGLAMKYLYNHKRNEFYKLWDFAVEHKSFESAFLLSFRYTTQDFSAFFEEYAHAHFRAEMLLASTSIFWGFLPIIFLLVVIIRRVRNRRILKKWEIEEEGIT